MFKKTLFSLLVIVFLVSTQALGQVFPIYQAEGYHFVAMRTANLGLSALIVDAPNTDAFEDQVWKWHEFTQSGAKAEQTEAEFESVMYVLDTSKCVGLLVFDREASPRYLDDEEFLREARSTSPYFQEGVGVYFQTLEGKRRKLTRLLNALIKPQEVAAEL